MTETSPAGECPSPPRSTVDAILRRRSIRRFDGNRPVPDDLLRSILELATLAPSSFNLQPWRFVVVRSAKNRRRLKACAFNQPKIGEAPVVVIVLGYLHPHRSHLEPMLETQLRLGAMSPAQAAEVRARAFRSIERVRDRALWSTRSTMLSAATLMLAAEAFGLASAPMEGFDPTAVCDAFGIPEDHTICCLIALGYPSETKPFPGRFGLDEVCYSEHFGQPWDMNNIKSEGQ